MQCGDRYHGVERTSFEGNVKEVAVPPLDGRAKVASPRPFEYTAVQIEPKDVRHAGPRQLRRQDAVAAPHVQNVARSMRESNLW